MHVSAVRTCWPSSGRSQEARAEPPTPLPSGGVASLGAGGGGVPAPPAEDPPPCGGEANTLDTHAAPSGCPACRPGGEEEGCRDDTIPAGSGDLADAPPACPPLLRRWRFAPGRQPREGLQPGMQAALLLLLLRRLIRRRVQRRQQGRLRRAGVAAKIEHAVDVAHPAALPPACWTHPTAGINSSVLFQWSDW